MSQRARRISAALLAVVLSAVVAGDTMAQEPLDTCEKQQSDAAAAGARPPQRRPDAHGA
jgi:hypothetical protein